MTISPFVSVPELTSKAALDLIEAASVAAASLGKPVSITVLNHSGRVISVLRMDGAPLQSLQVAHDKAYTAVGYGTPSESWIERGAAFGPTGTLLVTEAIDKLFPLAGGVPIFHETSVVGAIGISGATAIEDKAIAEVAIAAVLSGGSIDPHQDAVFQTGIDPFPDATAG